MIESKINLGFLRSPTSCVNLKCPDQGELKVIEQKQNVGWTYGLTEGNV